MTTGQRDNVTKEQPTSDRQVLQPQKPMITPLPFDSSLFGYAVGKCMVGEEWSQSDFLEAARSFRLVYLFSEEPLPIENSPIQPIDLRLTYFKNLKRQNANSAEIHSYAGTLTENLLNLALESGVFSRFHTDPNFVNLEFEKLYQRWIEKALTQHEVLLAKNQAGLVTCSIAEHDAQIGLIAVQKDQRGKGWGKKLIQAAENFAIQKEAQTMTIATQAANLPASALYKSLGYQLIERKYIYHFWR
ncbi:MAG: GNAT family N-acetyltransferase [Algoriphagus aquaeductus]|uniref:GNAT family N-acetyltransferase n=1 Tax=Algoriphagus aquaeductus TaxID=475299 RepID=UPI0015EB6D29|nr:GNAT family N-acetyltransferase [Algoriphagus aquaeductus]